MEDLKLEPTQKSHFPLPASRQAGIPRGTFCKLLIFNGSPFQGMGETSFKNHNFNFSEWTQAQKHQLPCKL